MYMLPTASSIQHLPTWFGIITAPDRWGHAPITEGRTWCMDNGVFTGRFNPRKFLTKLHALRPHATRCVFVAAPDVVADARGTLKRWRHWAQAIHAHGYPAAFVAQDGLQPHQIPRDAQAVFIGGSTEWKLGPDALAIIHEAKRRHLWVHIGRVNSVTRLKRFTLAGADSADGTTSAFCGVTRAAQSLTPGLNQPALVRSTWQ